LKHDEQNLRVTKQELTDASGLSFLNITRRIQARKFARARARRATAHARASARADARERASASPRAATRLLVASARRRASNAARALLVAPCAALIARARRGASAAAPPPSRTERHAARDATLWRLEERMPAWQVSCVHYSVPFFGGRGSHQRCRGVKGKGGHVRACRGSAATRADVTTPQFTHG